MQLAGPVHRWLPPRGALPAERRCVAADGSPRSQRSATGRQLGRTIDPGHPDACCLTAAAAAPTLHGQQQQQQHPAASGRARGSSSWPHRCMHQRQQPQQQQQQQRGPRVRSVLPLTSARTISATLPDPATIERVDALVIGSGPAGLATALMLQRRGWARIVVLDQNPSVETADPTKSYVYGIDARGRKALEALFGLSSQVQQLGIALSDVIKVPVLGPPKTFSRATAPNPDTQVFCMPRATFLQLLLEAIKAAGSAIQVLPNSTFLSYSCADSQPGGPMRVHALVQGARVTYEPTLLVGADGVQSIVRRKLAEADSSGSSFKMHKVSSPAAGLQVRGMLLPPNPSINVITDPKSSTSTSTSTCLPNHLLSLLSGKNKLFMAMFPTKDPSRPRIATIVQKPDHPLWSIRTTEGLYTLMEASFPQLPVRQLLTQQAADAFVNSSGVSFPRPQYCANMQALLWSPAGSDPGSGSGSDPGSRSGSGSDPGSGSRSESAARTAGEATPSGHTPSAELHAQERRQGPAGAGPAGERRLQAVLLVGDAVHCFPPDLGQGVNCALEDVCLLDQAMTECKGRLDLALPLYEQRRLPDIKALIRICQFGNPFQYDQDRLGRALWTLNVLMRRSLNQLLPWLVSPPAFIMMMDSSLSYSQVLARANASTRNLWLLVAAAAVLVVLFVSGRAP